MRILLFLGLLCLSSLRAKEPATPWFKLAVSEYPSWNLFLTAHDLGMIDQRAGFTGPIEERWGVDIILVPTDYKRSIDLYLDGMVDAVCITNMDLLAPSLNRPSVAILPTSTSNGADQGITHKHHTSLKDLKGIPVYGLDKSVSRYLFDRILEQNGLAPEDYPFVHMPPEEATKEFAKGEIEALVVWNPFCLQVKDNKDTHTIFSSLSIPDEIVDMVTVSAESLEKPGGNDFACAVIDTYYTFCRLMNYPDTRDHALISLGQRYSKLNLADMRRIIIETRFYDSPQKGIALFTSKDFSDTMQKVSDFCLTQGVVNNAPLIRYDTVEDGTDLLFDTQYIDRVVHKTH